MGNLTMSVRSRRYERAPMRGRPVPLSPGQCGAAGWLPHAGAISEAWFADRFHEFCGFRGGNRLARREVSRAMPWIPFQADFQDFNPRRYESCGGHRASAGAGAGGDARGRTRGTPAQPPPTFRTVCALGREGSHLRISAVDGVLAIVITIRVVALKEPHGGAMSVLTHLWPVFVCDLVSFVYVGIYWNDHPHLLYATTHVAAAILWTNRHTRASLPRLAWAMHGVAALIWRVPVRRSDKVLAHGEHGLVRPFSVPAASIAR